MFHRLISISKDLTFLYEFCLYLMKENGCGNLIFKPLKYNLSVLQKQNNLRSSLHLLFCSVGKFRIYNPASYGEVFDYKTNLPEINLFIPNVTILHGVVVSNMQDSSTQVLHYVDILVAWICRFLGIVSKFIHQLQGVFSHVEKIKNKQQRTQN